MINGHGHVNGSVANLPEGSTIVAPARDVPQRERSCSKRLADDGNGTGWCTRDDKHNGPCDGPRSKPPPASSYMPPSRSKPAAATQAAPAPPPAPPAPERDAQILAAVARAHTELAAAQRDLALVLTLLADRGKASR